MDCISDHFCFYCFNPAPGDVSRFMYTLLCFLSQHTPPQSTLSSFVVWTRISGVNCVCQICVSVEHHYLSFLSSQGRQLVRRQWAWTLHVLKVISGRFELFPSFHQSSFNTYLLFCSIKSSVNLQLFKSIKGTCTMWLSVIEPHFVNHQWLNSNPVHLFP